MDIFVVDGRGIFGRLGSVSVDGSGGAPEPCLAAHTTVAKSDAARIAAPQNAERLWRGR
jgi:hypothetical protein